MAEKYELNINITTSETSSTKSPRGKEKASVGKSTKGKGHGGNTFARPRTRNRKFSMDLLDYFKDSAEDKVYEKTIQRTRNKNKANRNKFLVGYGINTASDLLGELVSTTASNIGTFTSNQASQNSIDNVTNVTTDILSAVGTIGSGAAVGGWVGAIIAAVAVTAEKAMEVATASLKMNQENIKRNETSSRIRDRLGYIETGYSR